ncbi:MAG: hypothetical protein HYW50_01390 [Candidatus Diapherotrites archaeon]|nr:hypothetical protein [Candidatus Diapherotrites archaeon]
MPDSSLSKSRVIVFENSVLIEPNSFEEVARVSFLVAKTMFADSAEIIEIINGLVNVVKA